jgi:murein L,D-transpeptidase YafK
MMRILILTALIFFSSSLPPDSFRVQQKKNVRVKEAYEEVESVLKKKVTAKGLNWPLRNIFFRVFKEEEQLELWVQKNTGTYQLLETYEICSASGDPGPKRKQGDNQVPEGFYHIDRFNPFSSFHLSLGLNYPNTSDRILSDKKKPGGDIFIHGSCVSIGCMAMTDNKIKELYLFAVEAKNAGNKIPVHIFPCKLNSSSYTSLKSDYPEHAAFWKSLEAGFHYFEKNKKIPLVGVNSKGYYYIQS